MHSLAGSSGLCNGSRRAMRSALSLHDILLTRWGSMCRVGMGLKEDISINFKYFMQVYSKFSGCIRCCCTRE